MGQLCDEKCNNEVLDFASYSFKGYLPPSMCVTRFAGLNKVWKMSCGCDEDASLYCDSGMHIKNFVGLTLRCDNANGWKVIVNFQHGIQEYSYSEFYHNFNLRCTARNNF